MVQTAAEVGKTEGRTLRGWAATAQLAFQHISHAVGAAMPEEFPGPFKDLRDSLS